MSLSSFSNRENDFLLNDIYQAFRNKMMIMTLWLFVQNKKTFLINESYHQAFLNTSKVSPIPKIKKA